MDYGDEMVRSAVPDDVFDHLRKQDDAIAELRSDMAPVIEIIEKLDGFADFCQKWGRRINIALKWLAGVGPALILLWQWLSQPISDLFKAKNGG